MSARPMGLEAGHDATVALPRRFGKYRVERLLGEGALTAAHAPRSSALRTQFCGCKPARSATAETTATSAKASR